MFTQIKKAEKKKGINSEFSLKNIIPFLGLVFVVMLFAILTGGASIRLRNISRVALQSVLLITGSVGVIFTMSHGNLDLSLGGIVGMAAMVGGVVGTINPVFTIPAIIITAIIAELFIVAVHLALDVPAFIVSLAMMFITRGIVQSVAQTMQINLPAVFNSWNKPYIYFIILAVIVIIAYVIFGYTKIGKYNRAIGSNYTAAVTSGIPVNKYKILAFLMAGFAIGVAAFMNFVRAGGVSSTTGSGYELNILIALVLGGTSLTGGTSVKFRNAIIGCLILIVLENGLVMIGTTTQMVGLVKGAIFLASIALAYNRDTGQIIS